MTMTTGQPRASGPRFLMYSHDTFGLGHVRRALSLAAHFVEALPGAQVLIVTGSPLAHAYTLPPRTDYVKLPAVTKQGNGTYRACSLDMEFASIRDLRAALLCETARAYRPDVFMVDHAPNGLKGEALPTLALLRGSQPRCLRVLGQRDILDERRAVRRSWREEGVYHTLENDDDLILVYGSQQLYDVVAEYDLPAPVKWRVRYCGYLDRVAEEGVAGAGATPSSTPAPAAPGADPRVLALRRELLSSSGRLVVLTAGGGGDGFPLMRAYLLGLQRLPAPAPPFASALLTGPLMPEAEQRELRDLAATLPAGTVRLEAFLADPLPLLRAADLVVAMAGYNTACELLGLRQRVLFVPRATPRQEQLIRASLLSRHGLARMLHPEQATPERLIESVQQSLAQPRPKQHQLDAAGISFGGQAAALEAIIAGLGHVLEQRGLGERQVERVV